jgi:glycosyltransferase involved in cell wall biosynthesis
MSKPLVSVIIPAYNCAGVLSDAIDSVLKQTYGNIELVVVDDGSTDETGKIAEGYLESGKVRCYRQENGGPGAARNRGIEAARGEYLASRMPTTP